MKLFDFNVNNNNNNNSSLFSNSIQNNDFTSFFDSSIKIKDHEHPLIYCYSQERSCCGNGWNCNRCSKFYNYDEPSFYCTFCDYDLCKNCLGNFRLNEIQKNDKSQNNYNYLQNNLNNSFQWQKKFQNHNHLLTRIQRKNKTSWICNNCSREQSSNNSLFNSSIYSYHCSLCDYNVCQSCFDKPNCKQSNLFSLFPNSNRCRERICFDSDDNTLFKKPVIYLYPEKEMDISLELILKESEFTTIYPKFNDKNKWKVRAKPNGEITMNNSNKKYPYLYWEANSYIQQEMNEGFIVKAENAINFLEEKLEILGLNDKESTDFITFWLPLLLKNKLSLCTFQTEKFFDNIKMNITPKPDTLIRIFLSIKKINAPINIKEQKLERIQRKGFTVIEWGGSEC
jgi:hypothetical protein